MQRFFSRTTKLDSILLILVSVLLLSFHFYFIYYVNSTYVAAYVGEKFVSLIFGLGALFNIILFLLAPKILRKFGIIKMTLTIALIEILAVLVMAFPMYPAIAILAFLLHMMVAAVLIYCMDMLLEHYSEVEDMGSIRGMFLTMWNIPVIITPFIAGIILGNDTISFNALGESAVGILHNAGFWKIYLIGAIFLIPFAIILKVNFSKFKDPIYPKMNVRQTLRSFYDNHNIFDIFADRLLLNLYFAWSVVYLPIYLHHYVGFAWSEIGIILSISCLPYVLFQRLIGKIQDRLHDEKKILIWGFFLLALSTFILPFLNVQNIYLWIVLLFMAHIGGAFVEVSSESYFFKHVSPTDSTFISLFRMTRTLPYIIMPPIIAISLAFLPFGHMFFILSIIMFVGMRYAFMIEEEPVLKSVLKEQYIPTPIPEVKKEPIPKKRTYVRRNPIPAEESKPAKAKTVKKVSKTRKTAAK